MKLIYFDQIVEIRRLVHAVFADSVSVMAILIASVGEMHEIRLDPLAVTRAKMLVRTLVLQYLLNLDFLHLGEDVSHGQLLWYGRLLLDFRVQLDGDLAAYHELMVTLFAVILQCHRSRLECFKVR